MHTHVRVACMHMYARRCHRRPQRTRVRRPPFSFLLPTCFLSRPDLLPRRAAAGTRLESCSCPGKSLVLVLVVLGGCYAAGRRVEMLW